MRGYEINGSVAVPERVRIVMGLLKSAAERGDLCPSNDVIAERLGAQSMSSGANVIALLESMGLITVKRYHSGRQVTIAETGKSTASIAGPERKPRTKSKPDAPTQIETKVCHGCGGTVYRGKQKAAAKWAVQRFCSQGCAIKTARREHVKPSDSGSTPLQPGHDWTQVSAEASNTAMMRSLLRYGWRHDGLPGLPAERFRELAQEYGVAA